MTDVGGEHIRCMRQMKMLTQNRHSKCESREVFLVLESRTCKHSETATQEARIAPLHLGSAQLTSAHPSQKLNSAQKAQLNLWQEKSVELVVLCRSVVYFVLAKAKTKNYDTLPPCVIRVSLSLSFCCHMICRLSYPTTPHNTALFAYQH